MSRDLDSAVAVIEDWRSDHCKEHDKVWERIDQNRDEHIDFIKAIKCIETKLAIYTSLGVAVGSLSGSIIGAMLVRFFSK
jgi:hypothetical protein